MGLTLEYEVLDRKISEEHLVDYLRSMLRSIENATEFRDLDRYIHELEEWIFLADEQGIDYSYVLTNFSQLDLQKFNDAYCEWESELERLFTESLLSGDCSSLNEYRLSARFERLLKREVSLLTVKNPKRALLIGSGPFPISGIYLQRMLGIPVDCLDNQPASVAQSRHLIKEMALEGLEVILDDGCSVDASAYDVVLVALLSKPKPEILKNLYCKSNDHCQVICRTSHGFRRLVYETTDLKNHHSHYYITGRRNVEGPGDTISSALLQKEPLSQQRARDIGTSISRQSPVTQHQVIFTWPTMLSPLRKRRIVDLLNAILATETQIGFPGVMPMEEGLAFVNNLQEEITANNCLLFNILHGDGEVVGMAILKRDLQPNCKHVVEVCKGMIHPKFRGEGVMEAAFLEIGEKCLEQGMELLKLDVRKGTKAEQVWKFIGFKTYGHLEDYAREDGQVFAGAFMCQYACDLIKRLTAALAAKGIA